MGQKIETPKGKISLPVHKHFEVFFKKKLLLINNICYVTWISWYHEKVFKLPQNYHDSQGSHTVELRVVMQI